MLLVDSNPHHAWVSMLNYAFGIKDRSKMKRVFDAFIDNDFQFERKQRIDTDSTIFTSEKKRKTTFTAYNVFKKQKCAEFRETFVKILEKILRHEYNKLTDEDRTALQIKADQELQRAPFIWGEIKEFLLKTKGKVSYRSISNNIGPIVSHATIYRILNRQEGWHMRKDRTLPSLDIQAKKRRLQWSHSFWLFYISASCVPVQKAIFVTVHMDEKWFRGIVNRTNNKVLTSIGLEGVDYFAHHKAHIDKIMYIVVTAFALTNDNDITKGGVVVPVSCIRVGKMMKAQRDSWKKVYDENGNRLKTDANISRRRGDEYFKPMEITGSSEGTANKPKFSLWKAYKNYIIPDLEKKVIRRFSNNGQRRVIVVLQEDGAGPHKDQRYLRRMQRVFHKKGWIKFNQPSQSPVTNVHDACIFPMMSKEVSNEQAVMFGSKLLRGEQLHKAVMNVWHDKRNELAMARAFAGHHQIVSSIMNYKGDNNYLFEKGGLSFGIRKTFIGNEEGNGVIPVTLAPDTDEETLQGQILHQMKKHKLKYEKPAVSVLEKAQMTKEMRELFCELMDPHKMSHDLHTAWFKLTEGVPL